MSILGCEATGLRAKRNDNSFNFGVVRTSDVGTHELPEDEVRKEFTVSGTARCIKEKINEKKIIKNN